ncbi:non-ribosomal peptide synthetase [Rheinheimera oceanensis]|uniref:non-ribosomal peptide synthetase n=1 Tax=Rheinheimera oceanensis TaxID=2817449 RepID=UPI001BFD2DB9|nr:non-ribosomal peptide synthetase [Rheinheimera oceanensis]
MTINKALFDLSISQKDIYFDQLHHAGSPLYNIGGFVRCWSLEIGRIRHAHREVVLNHEAFGIRIVHQEHEVKQYVSSDRTIELPLLDFSDRLDPKKAAFDWMDELFNTPIPYYDSELTKATLVKISATEYWYVGLSHHLAMDGWGFSNWAHKLADYYNEVEGEPTKLGSWQQICRQNQEYVESKRYALDKEFWLDHCANVPDKILTGHYISEIDGPRSTRYRVAISRSVYNDYSKAAESMETGVSQLFLAMLAIYFAKTYSRDKISFGTPFHNRKNHAQKKMIGVFTSVSPLIVGVDKSQSCISLVKQITRLQRASFRHQGFPIGHLMQSLGLTGEHNEMYDVCFNFLKLDYSGLSFDSHHAEVVYHTHNRIKAPLTVTIWDGGAEDIELQLDYNHGYFCEDEIHLLAKRFEHILGLLTCPEQQQRPITELELIPSDEAKMLCQSLNDTQADYNKNHLMHQLFEAQAKKTPDRVAVMFEQDSMTYHQLNCAANRLAQYLREQGIGVEEFVGICVERSLDMLVGILAVLKVGGAYVSLDPNYPQNRLDYITEDTSLNWVLTQSELVGKFDRSTDLTCIELDDPAFKELLGRFPESDLELAEAQQPNKLAYVIYTSGSTGKPKGVMIEHRNAVAMLSWAIDYFSANEMQCVLACTSLNFDLSVFELFAPLSCGGSCLIVENILMLVEHNYEDKGITMINSVPSGVSAVLKENRIPSSVKTINLAGEALRQSLVNDLHQLLSLDRVVNLYGPSEDTTYSTVMAMDDMVQGSVLIGRPITNTQAYILNEARELLPMGVVGELYLGGDGLSRGYLNRPDLNSSVFIKNSFSDNDDGRLYKTGDLVRYMPDGNLAYVGRIDEQVKIRGFRIELKEVEHHLGNCANVAASIVVARDDESGSKRLVAYVEMNGDEDEAEFVKKLKDALHQSMPQYMVPSAFVLITEWPLSLNGKIDKKALPAPDGTDMQGHYVQPETASEKLLTDIWAKILELDAKRISVTANFFTLGGHSLLAMRMIAEIRTQMACELPVETIFTAQNIRRLAALVDKGSELPIRPAVCRLNVQSDKMALSYAQHPLWFIDQMEGSSVHYNMPAAFRVDGRLNLEAVERAVTNIVKRHQPLRTVFAEHDGDGVQIIRDEFNFALDYFDLRQLDTEYQHDTANELILYHAKKTFDLSKDLMIRVGYIDLSCTGHDQQGILLFNMHHIASDGWSVNIMLKEFAALYEAALEDAVDPLPPLEIQYSDYVYWQQHSLQGELLDAQLCYWSKQLEDAPIVHSLQLDHARPEKKLFRGEVVTGHVDSSFTEQLMEVAAKHDVTPFMLLHAVLCLVISRHSNSQDIVIGTPTANRTQAELVPLVGFFVNTLVLRVDTDYKSFPSYLKHVKEVNLAAQANQDVPFESLVENLKPPRTSQHSPLFQITFSMDTNDFSELNLPGVQISELPCREVMAKFDLDISTKINEDGIFMSWVYDTSLFTQHHVQSLSDHFHELLLSVARNPDGLLSELPMLLPEEVEYLVKQCNATDTEYQNEMLIHELFEACVHNAQDGIALVYENEKYSYRELDKLSSQWAHYLRNAGVTTDSVVGICTTRSTHMIVAMLAILKAGGAYVPLDANYPVRRLEYMIENSGLQHLVTISGLTDRLQIPQGVSLIELDSESFSRQLQDYPDSRLERAEGQDSDSLAYVIYTSGSTGQPKGVGCLHRSLINLLTDMQTRGKIGVGDNCSVWTNISFDVSVYEIMSALCSGATLHVVPEQVRLDKELMFHWMQEHQIHSAYLPAFYLLRFAAKIRAREVKSSLKLLLVGVEPIVESVLVSLQKHIEGLQVVNGYGPSETTVCCTLYNVPNNHIEEGKNFTPIGKPVANTKTLILSKNMELCPVGVTGELYVGGDGLARGYINNSAMTAERFIVNPFGNSPEDRLYRTGDLVRRLPDSNIQFVGRIDDQIKIRGFRVELGEVMSQITACAGVDSSLVMLFEDLKGEKSLVAYMVPEDAGSDEQTLVRQVKQSIGTVLPNHMIPSAFVVIEQWPTTLNGKVDRRALPKPDYAVLQGKYVAPKNDTEQTLVDIWAELLNLNVAEISTEANFFEIGGNSLLSSKLIHIAGTQHGLSIAIIDIFQCPTVCSLAVRALNNAQGTSKSSALLPLQKSGHQGPVPLSFTQHLLWFVEQLEGQTNKHNITGGVKVHGKFSVNIACEVLTFLVAKHPILKTRISVGNDGLPMQFFDESLKPKLEVLDLSNGAEDVRDKTYTAKASEFGTRCFDLNRDALFAVLIAKLSDTQWRLFVNFHHLISDGWSINTFFNEFMQVYDDIADGKRLAICEHALGYHDFVLWQQEFLNTPLAEEQREFWAQYLFGCNQVLQLPFSPAANPSEDPGEMKLANAVDSETRNKLLKLAHKHKVSLFNVIHSALANVLSRLSGESDLNIGVPITGRNLAGVENILGVFINNLPVRCQLDMSESFDQCIIEQSRSLARALSHQELPFQKILETIDVQRDASTPLFQVLLNVLSLPPLELSGHCVDIEVDFAPPIEGKFDITLYVNDTDNGMSITCNYNKEVYGGKYVGLMLDQLVCLLYKVAEDSSKPCGSYSLVWHDDLHRQPVSTLSQANLLPDPRLLTKAVHEHWAGSVHYLFEEAAETYGDRMAVKFGDVRWNYRQLNELSHAFAHYLKKRGIGRGDVIGIIAQRNHYLVLATFAVLKSGAAFVMLADDTPIEKLNSQIELASPVAFITLDGTDVSGIINDYQEKHFVPEFNVAQLLLQLSDYPEAAEFVSENVDGDALAYIAFTSGTEGKSKVVRGRHSALSYYLPWTAEHFSITEQCRFAMLSGLMHDPLQRDMFTPLCVGAQLYIPEDIKDVVKLTKWLNEMCISVLNITPSLGSFLWGGNTTRLMSLRLLFSAGEPLTQAHLKTILRISDNVRVVNLYGSTETCRALGFFEVTAQYLTQHSSGNVPVGRGMGDCQLIVLNQNLHQCGIGELGQIGIRSRHLSLGYHDNPKETADKFIANPFCSVLDDSSDIIYLTGDLGRYHDDGSVICLGRNDRQIKVRGFRVELGEIESAIVGLEMVDTAAVVVKQRNENENYLVAYLTLSEQSKGKSFEAAQIKALLKNKLAGYMVPQSIYAIDSLPRTANGKLDTRALLELSDTELEPQREIVAPQTHMERNLLPIWQEILKRDDISITDDFFKLGGHSLLSTQLLSRVQSQAGVEISIKIFFEDSSIKNIAAKVEENLLVNSVLNNISDKREKNKLSL